MVWMNPSRPQIINHGAHPSGSSHHKLANHRPRSGHKEDRFLTLLVSLPIKNEVFLFAFQKCPVEFVAR